MKKTEIMIDIESVPPAIRPHMKSATMYDSSCSEQARTLFMKGEQNAFLNWGLWTLRYNLKTDDYKDIFLDAYGRDKIDADGLNYFTKLMELTG